MTGSDVRPIVIAAGGTGGHFYPAEALAATLIERGQWVVLMTDARSGALKSTVFDARNQFVLPGAGIAGRGALRAGGAVFSLAAGVARARGIMRQIQPAAVVAFGGYPSVPPVLATRFLRERPPVILHEQNAVLGRANRFLSRHASVLALSFAGTSRVPSRVRRLVTGNPVRPAVTVLSQAGYEAPAGPRHDGSIEGGSIRLLVLGGSLGARVFSDVVPAALARLPEILRARLHGHAAMPRRGPRPRARRLFRQRNRRRSGVFFPGYRRPAAHRASGDRARRRLDRRRTRGRRTAVDPGASTWRDRRSSERQCQGSGRRGRRLGHAAARLHARRAGGTG